MQKLARIMQAITEPSPRHLRPMREPSRASEALVKYHLAELRRKNLLRLLYLFGVEVVLLRRLEILGKVLFDTLVIPGAGDRGAMDRIDNQHLADKILGVGGEINWHGILVLCAQSQQRIRLRFWR